MSFIFCSKRVILSLLISIIFFSCEKSEGIGGTSTIKEKFKHLKEVTTPLLTSLIQLLFILQVMKMYI